MTCQLVEQAMYTSDFQSLTAEELTSLLSDDHLNARREETVFEAVARWVLEDPDSRRHSLAKLLPCVRFGFITPDYYSHVIKRFPYFTQVPSVTSIVIRTAVPSSLVLTLKVVFPHKKDFKDMFVFTLFYHIVTNILYLFHSDHGLL